MLVNKQRIGRSIAIKSLVAILSFISLRAESAIPQDPFETMNRGIYQFNRALDKGLVRKIAYGYWAYTPKELQAGVHNFFENLGQPITIANDLLQCKIGYAFHDTSRFVINSIFGVGGFFEVAAFFGLEPRKEDFGQTMWVWGYKQSIYLVLPILGPSTLRDTIGFFVDSFYFDPISYIHPDSVGYGLAFARMFDKRLQLLQAETLLANVGVDEYVFVRDVYFQKRNLAFHDGQLPESDQSDPFAEPGFESASEQSTDEGTAE